MSAVAGVLGSIVGIVAAVIGGAVTITVIVVLFKSPGAVPGLIGLIGDLIGLAASAITGFFGFLGDLLTFAGS